MHTMASYPLDIYRTQDHLDDLAAYRALKSFGARRDLLTLQQVLSYGALSWILPPRSWAALLRTLMRIQPPETGEPLYRTINAVLNRPPQDPIGRRVQREFRAAYAEEECHFMRHYRPSGFDPDVVLEGRSQIVSALDAGKGAILWTSPFAFSSLMPKVAFARAGYPVHHLTSPLHGYSVSRFAVHWLNPLRTRVENRYLQERIFLGLSLSSSSSSAMQTLRLRLAQNLPVSIMTAGVAHKVLDVPFIGGRLLIPTGAIKLALTSGAQLLPVFMSRRQRQDDGFVVHVEPPLRPTNAVETTDRIRTSSPAVIELAIEYARRLEPYVLRDPGLWRGWKKVVKPDSERLDQAVKETLWTAGDR
jgi:hypothetical protein